MTPTQAVSKFKITAHDTDAVVRARGEGRAMALQLGFSPPRILLVTTVIAELARNIVMYAKAGEIRLVPCCADGCIDERAESCSNEINEGHAGLSIIASDEGPGIHNLERAMLCGYSTSGSQGCGLPGVSRIADEFTIDSRPGFGTTVGVILWRDPSRPGQRVVAPE